MTSWTKYLRALLVLVGLSAGAAGADGPALQKGDGKALPVGWYVTQSAPNLYEAGVDTAQPCEGTRSAFLRSRTEATTGYGTFMQAFGAQDFRGRRLRFSAAVRLRDVTGWAGLWMRVEGEDPKQPLGFDNMQSRALAGTTGCKRYDVVLDVPQEARAIMAGLLLSGTGQAWLDGVRFEVVDRSVPVTDLLAAHTAPLPPGPQGLDGVAAAPSAPQVPTGRVGDIWFNRGRVDMEMSYTRQANGVWRSILAEELTENGNEVKGSFLQRPVAMKVKTEGKRTTLEGTWGSDPVRIQLDSERLSMKWGIYERELLRRADYKQDPTCARYQRIEGPRTTDQLDVCGAALSTKPPPAQLVLAFLGNGFRRVAPYGTLPPPAPPRSPRDAMQVGASPSGP